MSITALAIAVLVGVNGIWIGNAASSDGGRRPGLFDGNPGLGVAVFVACIVVAAWVDIR